MFRPLTKGFEFEFLYLWRFDTDSSGNAEIPIEGKAAILNGYVVVKRSAIPFSPLGLEDPVVLEFYGARAAERAISTLLTSNDIEVNENSVSYMPLVDPNHRNAGNTILPLHYRWSISVDGSMFPFDDNELNSTRYTGAPFYVADMELISPALLANSKESDDEVSKVVKLITSHLIYLVPRTTGFHIHIGQGPEVFEIGHLKNIAVVLYMVDIWFKDLHPVHRRRIDHPYCPSVRKRSDLARGLTAEAANAYVLGGEANTVRDVVGPDGRKPSDAWAEISVARVPAAICRLMYHHENTDRGTYNFNDVLDPSKPTIEFRQAAGTLNTEWIRHWSAIVVATVDWARRASEEDIRRLVAECEMKEDRIERYPLDEFLRYRLRIPDTADYIARTTPDTRATPRLEGVQRAWRAADRRIERTFGKAVLPRTNWP